MFPILSWISRYNLTWLTGDLIAGITVGIVAVPQAMSYAIIATLPAEYGLYSSFVGTLIYCVRVLLTAASMSSLMSLIVLRYIQGCVYRSRRCYVIDCGASNQTCRRLASQRVAA